MLATHTLIISPVLGTVFSKQMDIRKMLPRNSKLTQMNCLIETYFLHTIAQYLVKTTLLTFSKKADDCTYLLRLR